MMLVPSMPDVTSAVKLYKKLKGKKVDKKNPSSRFSCFNETNIFHSECFTFHVLVIK